MLFGGIAAAVLLAGCTSSSEVQDEYVGDLEAFRYEGAPDSSSSGGVPEDGAGLSNGRADAGPGPVGDLTTVDPEVQAAQVALFCEEYSNYQQLESRILNGSGGATPLEVRFLELGSQAIVMQVAVGSAATPGLEQALERFTAGLLLGSNPAEPAMLSSVTVIDEFVGQNCT